MTIDLVVATYNVRTKPSEHTSGRGQEVLHIVSVGVCMCREPSPKQDKVPQPPPQSRVSRKQHVQVRVSECTQPLCLIVHSISSSALAPDAPVSRGHCVAGSVLWHHAYVPTPLITSVCSAWTVTYAVMQDVQAAAVQQLPAGHAHRVPVSSVVHTPSDMPSQLVAANAVETIHVQPELVQRPNQELQQQPEPWQHQQQGSEQQLSTEHWQQQQQQQQVYLQHQEHLQQLYLQQQQQLQHQQLQQQQLASSGEHQAVANTEPHHTAVEPSAAQHLPKKRPRVPLHEGVGLVKLDITDSPFSKKDSSARRAVHSPDEAMQLKAKYAAWPFKCLWPAAAVNTHRGRAQTGDRAVSAQPQSGRAIPTGSARNSSAPQSRASSVAKSDIDAPSHRHMSASASRPGSATAGISARPAQKQAPKRIRVDARADVIEELTSPPKRPKSAQTHTGTAPAEIAAHPSTLDMAHSAGSNLQKPHLPRAAASEAKSASLHQQGNAQRTSASNDRSRSRRSGHRSRERGNSREDRRASSRSSSRSLSPVQRLGRPTSARDPDRGRQAGASRHGSQGADRQGQHSGYDQHRGSRNSGHRGDRDRYVLQEYIVCG